jgi:hypothetical protein
MMMMATAAQPKPTSASLPGKLKRPSQPYAQNGVVNGIRTPQQPSPAALPAAAAAAAANRVAAAKQQQQQQQQLNSNAQNNNIAMAAVSGVNGGRAAAKTRKDSVRNGDPMSRLQRPAGRMSGAEAINGDRRQLKRFPEPYGECDQFTIVTSPLTLLQSKLPPTYSKSTPDASHHSQYTSIRRISASKGKMAAFHTTPR